MSSEASMPQSLFASSETSGPSEHLAIINRRKKPMLLTAGIFFSLAVLLAMLWPATYRATATILIEEQEIPQDMVRSTITNFATQQIEVITQRVMTKKNILAMIEKFDLYTEDELKRRSKTAIANEFQNSVSLDLMSAEAQGSSWGKPNQATIAFALSFDSADAGKAQRVTDELVSLYMNENQRNRVEKTESIEVFLRKEADVLNEELAVVEEELAEFKRAHKNALPASYNYNVQNQARLDSRLLSGEVRLRELSQRELELSAKLDQTSAYAPTVLASGESVLADVDRLKALQSEYRQKAATYNVNHPDIKKLKREIDQLSATVGHAGDRGDLQRLLKDRQAELDTLQDKYSPDHPDVVAKKRLIEQLQTQLALADSGAPDVKPNSPSYIFLDNQLSTLRMEKSQLQQETASLSQQVAKLDQALSDAPAVEKEYVQLQRTLQSTQDKYLDLKLKLREAELAGALEQGLKGQRFTLLEPAVIPEAPISPNRPILIIVGFILAMAAGIGSAVVLEALDQSISTEKTLIAVTGSPPLVSIPYIKNPKEQDIGRSYLHWFIYGCIALLAIAAVLMMVNFLYEPLDVLWFVMLDKLGIG